MSTDAVYGSRFELGRCRRRCQSRGWKRRCFRRTQQKQRAGSPALAARLCPLAAELQAAPSDATRQLLWEESSRPRTPTATRYSASAIHYHAGTRARIWCSAQEHRPGESCSSTLGGCDIPPSESRNRRRSTRAPLFRGRAGAITTPTRKPTGTNKWPPGFGAHVRTFEFLEVSAVGGTTTTRKRESARPAVTSPI